MVMKPKRPPAKITSRQNPLFQQWLELKEGRGIKRHGQLLVAGRKSVPEVLSQRLEACVAIVSTPKSPPLEAPAKVPEFSLPSELFRELDVFGTHFPLVVLRAPPLVPWEPSTPPEGLELLCALGDPTNVGALLRAALAFGVQQVVLLKESASPFHPRALRASAGAALTVQLSRGPSVMDLQSSPDLWALDSSGQDIGQFDWPRNLRLLLGEEGQGVPPHLREGPRLAIPIAATVESLNAVSAASIAFFLYQRSQ